MFGIARGNIQGVSDMKRRISWQDYSIKPLRRRRSAGEIIGDEIRKAMIEVAVRQAADRRTK